MFEAQMREQDFLVGNPLLPGTANRAACPRIQRATAATSETGSPQAGQVWAPHGPELLRHGRACPTTVHPGTRDGLPPRSRQRLSSSGTIPAARAFERGWNPRLTETKLRIGYALSDRLAPMCASILETTKRMIQLIDELPAVAVEALLEHVKEQHRLQQPRTAQERAMNDIRAAYIKYGYAMTEPRISLAFPEERSENNTA
jgi:hypothetical protein